MPERAYDLFARVYDAWQAGFPRPFSDAILPFYEDEILRRGTPAPLMADLACGTGIFLHAWRAKYPAWRLFGTDASSRMLGVARTRLRSPYASGHVKLLHQRLEETRLPERVGAAVCVFDSLNHLTTDAALRRCVSRVGENLLPGGLFVFDLNDERSFRRLFEGSWSVETDRFHATITAAHTPDGDHGVLRFTAFTPTGRAWRRHDFAIEERNWRAPFVRACLAEAGLAVLRVRRIQPYPVHEVDAPRTLWVCRKKKTLEEA